MKKLNIFNMLRLSIPVKIFLACGLSYMAILFISTWITIYFQLDLASTWHGVPLRLLFLFLQILVPVLVAVVTSYFFLDRPLANLREVMTKAGEGDFLVRSQLSHRDEIGLLAQNFNKMLAEWTDLSARKIQTDHDLIIAQEELKYKKSLEEKNRLIEKANHMLESLVKDLSILYDIGQSINQTMDAAQTYEVIGDALKRHLKLENFSLMMWDEKNQLLRVKAAFGFEQKLSVLQITFQMGEGIAGEVLKTGRPVYVEDLRRDDRFVDKRVQIQGSILSIPLKYQNEILGVINFGRNQAGAFSPHDNKMFNLVANQVALAIANARLYTQTKELSVTDELTGVFNRRHFSQVLQIEWKRAVRFKRDLSLLMCDVDYFKRYNDTFGHLKGDEVLKQIGTLLNSNLREVDTVARFGGEEFIILLPDTDKRGALAVAEKLRHIVQEKIEKITMSIGVANFPDDVQEMDDLIDHADIALYDAKDTGRNRVLTYSTAKQTSEPAPPQTQEEKEGPTTKPRLVH